MMNSFCFLFNGLIQLIGMIAIALLTICPGRYWIVNTLLRLWYGRKIIDSQHVPTTGPFLLLCHHVTFIDPLLIVSALKRPILFFLPKEELNRYPVNCLRWFGWLKVEPVDSSLPAKVTAALDRGMGVALFPEGQRTPTGQILSFSPAFYSFIEPEKKIPIIPVAIGGFIGSFFSSDRQNNWLMIPRALLEARFVAFGKAMMLPFSSLKLFQTISELMVDARAITGGRLPLPQLALISNCKKKRWNVYLIDSLGVKLTGWGFLIRALVARRLLRRVVLDAKEKNVGCLVPMSVGGCIVNAALALDSRVAINLNHTFGTDILNYCIEQAQIKHILTSRKLVERFPNLKLDAPFVFMEDLLVKVSLRDKISSLLEVLFLPGSLLCCKLGLTKKMATETLSIIYTSGSTGKPKGVVLSHDNIAAVARSFFEAIQVRRSDVMLGILPFFHSFGYVGNFWMTFIGGCKSILHFNPLEAKKVGEMARKYRCNFFPCTPTFLRNYVRRCDKIDFQGVKTVLTGAEKLPLDLIELWQEKFGARPTEGYGTTELSPCPMVNVPDVRVDTYPINRNGYNDFLRPQIFRKDGSAGRPFARTVVKTVDLETGITLDADQVGMLSLKGPMVMQGYYRLPEQTAMVIDNEGWYFTGDIAKLDDDGFVWITGRQSRISKIGGEMIPHILIEEEIDKILVRNSTVEVTEQTGPLCAVTALPDQNKGERIIVLYVPVGVTPERICETLRQNDFPNLWIPSLNNFVIVESIPVLGTGKLDLAAVKKKAEDNG